MNYENLFFFLLGFMIMMAINILISVTCTHIPSYKKGQIDALHGKWKYKLVTTNVVEEIK